VECAHEERARPFPQGVVAHDVAQLRDELLLLPGLQPQLGLDPVLDGGEPQLLQARRPGGRVRRVGERRTPPQVERLPQRGGRTGQVTRAQRPLPVGGQPREPVHVHVLRLHREAVAGRMELDRRVLPQGLPQPRHLRLEGVGGAGRRAVAVKAVDQALGRRDPARVEQQEHQQRAGARPAGGHLDPTGAEHLHRAEHPVPHGSILPVAA
jgi:hypothetical protein